MQGAKKRGKWLMVALAVMVVVAYLRLPYSHALYLVSTGGTEYER